MEFSSPGGSQVLPSAFFSVVGTNNCGMIMKESSTESRKEKGEQGDVLMPLFALFPCTTFCIGSCQSQDGGWEVFLAFLDAVYVVTTPGRVGDVYVAFQEKFHRHARIWIHVGRRRLERRWRTSM